MLVGFLIHITHTHALCLLVHLLMSQLCEFLRHDLLRGSEVNAELFSELLTVNLMKLEKVSFPIDLSIYLPTHLPS